MPTGTIGMKMSKSLWTEIGNNKMTDALKAAVREAILTTDSAAVQLFAAVFDDAHSKDLVSVASYLNTYATPRKDALRLAAEHERLYASRIAAAEKAARVGALREALECHPTTAENPNENSYQRGRFDGVIEYGRAIGALITAAEAQPERKSTP